MKIETWTKESFSITTDPERMQPDRIHRFLTSSYWAAGIPISTVRKSIAHSMCFGVFAQVDGAEIQIGFARVVSDFATFGYIGDVYVEPEWRGKGLSKWLMECIQAHPELQGFRRMCLVTKDAHGLYRQFGFKVTETPDRWMEIKNPDVYRKS